MAEPTLLQRRPSLADQVYEVLCQRLVTGELEPGDRLIFEQLAQALGVSMTPVRDAAIRLAHEGLATETPSGRLQVTPITTEYVGSVYAVRIPLEGVAAALAASALTDDDLAGFRLAFDEVVASSTPQGNAEPRRPVLRRFHERIHEVSTNPILSRELRVLSIHSEYILSYAFRRFGAALRVSFDEHLVILDALMSRDPERARKAMELHMQSAGERILTLIESHSELASGAAHQAR